MAHLSRSHVLDLYRSDHHSLKERLRVAGCMTVAGGKLRDSTLVGALALCNMGHSPEDICYLLYPKRLFMAMDLRRQKNLHSVTDMHLATPSPRDDATVVVVVVVVTLLPLRAPPYAAWVRAIIFLFSRRSNHDFSDNI